MGDDIERRLTALETHIPYIRDELKSQRETMLDFHAESKKARAETNEKLDALIAKDNQNKGAQWLLDKSQNLIMFLVGIGAFKWLGLIR